MDAVAVFLAHQGGAAEMKEHVENAKSHRKALIALLSVWGGLVALVVIFGHYWHRMDLLAVTVCSSIPSYILGRHLRRRHADVAVSFGLIGVLNVFVLFILFAVGRIGMLGICGFGVSAVLFAAIAHFSPDGGFAVYRPAKAALALALVALLVVGIRAMYWVSVY